MSEIRDNKIDIYKGLLIILVVLGHSNFKYSIIIFWFHMPLFYIVSGFLWKNKHETFGEYIKPKLIRLLIPFVIYFILLEVFPMLIIEKLDLLKFIQRCLMFIWSGKLYRGVYWYIPSLILAYIFVFFINRLENSLKILMLSLMYLLPILISVFFIPNNIAEIPTLLRLPWNLDVSILGSFYMCVGIIFKRKMAHIKSAKKSSINIVIAFAFAVVFIVLILYQKEFVNYEMNMKYSQYKSFVFPALLPLVFGILLWFVVKIFTKFPILRTVLSIFGQASLVIMYTHEPIRQYLFEAYLGENYLTMIYVLICCTIGSGIYLLVHKTKFRKYLI